MPCGQPRYTIEKFIHDDGDTPARLVKHQNFWSGHHGAANRDLLTLSS